MRSPPRASRTAAALVAGAPADLVILAGDPATDATALAHVRYTIRAGRVIYQRE
jgi:imidazolonepropionase-like amidohydrolase